MRFTSIAGYLPRDEAEGLRAQFGVEMLRIDELEDERAGWSRDEP